MFRDPECRGSRQISRLSGHPVFEEIQFFVSASQIVSRQLPVASVVAVSGMSREKERMSPSPVEDLSRMLLSLVAFCPGVVAFSPASYTPIFRILDSLVGSHWRQYHWFTVDSESLVQRVGL